MITNPEEKIFFSNSSGSKLCGVLRSPAQSPLVIVICHGFNSSKDSLSHVLLARRLAEKGIASFRFDFFGNGESEGLHEDITTSEALDDLRCAVALLKKLGYTKVGLFGSSFGGMTSILAASEMKDLQLLVLKSPVSQYSDKLLTQLGVKQIDDWRIKGHTDYPTSDGQSRRLKYAFYQDACGLDGYAAAEKINAPTLIIHGDADRTVLVEQSIKSAKLIKNCRLEVLPGADHRYSKPEDFEKALSLALDFIRQNALTLS